MTKLFRYKTRRIFARFMLPILTVWLCIVPSRSYAFAPAIYGIYAASSAMGLGGGAVVGADLFAGMLAIGAGFGLLLVSTPAGDQARLPLTSAPANVPAAPTGAPSSLPALQPIWSSGGSTQAQANTCTGGVIAPIYSDASSSCRASVCLMGQTSQLGFSKYVDSSAVLVSGLTYYCTGHLDETPVGGSSSTAVTVGNIYGSSGCPSGYTITGTAPNQTCALSSARLATPDKACDYARSGSALAMISDPDCAGSGTVIPAICASGGVSCSGVGTSPTGEPRSYIITPTANGGSTVQTFQQGTVSGTTVVTTTTTTVGPDSTVTGVSSSTSTGSINTSTGTVTTGTTITPTTPSPAPVINFPTDYARTGEAATAAATLAPKLDTLHNDLNPTSFNDTSGTTVPPIIVALDGRPNQLTTLTANTPTVNLWMPSLLPGAVVACKPIPIGGTFTSGVLNGISGTASLDICDQLDQVRQLLGWLLSVFTVVHIFRLFMRSNSGGA